MSTHQKKHTKNTGGSKELVYRSSEDEHYAVVGAPQGSARFKVTLHSTNEEVTAKARGTLIKGPNKKRIEKDMYVLVQSDSSNTADDKYYIIHVYSPDDVKRLRKAGELAQVKQIDEEEKVAVAFEGDVVSRVREEVEIDDDFIANL